MQCQNSMIVLIIRITENDHYFYRIKYISYLEYKIKLREKDGSTT